MKAFVLCNQFVVRRCAMVCKGYQGRREQPAGWEKLPEILHKEPIILPLLIIRQPFLKLWFNIT